MALEACKQTMMSGSDGYIAYLARIGLPINMWRLCQAQAKIGDRALLTHSSSTGSHSGQAVLNFIYSSACGPPALSTSLSSQLLP